MLVVFLHAGGGGGGKSWLVGVGAWEIMRKRVVVDGGGKGLAGAT